MYVPFPLDDAPLVPAIDRTALRGSFLLLEPTYTVLGYVLMNQSWARVSQLLRSRRVSSAVKVLEAPAAMGNLSNWRSATLGSLGPPSEM